MNQHFLEMQHGVPYPVGKALSFLGPGSNGLIKGALVAGAIV
jgi:hypothetical protein